jgi:hypothetical protein
MNTVKDRDREEENTVLKHNTSLSKPYRVQLTPLPLCQMGMYRIFQPIRRTFVPEKCDLNSTYVLCAEGKYYFQTYKYPYPHRVKTTMKIISVAVTTIFWVSIINKLYYGC